MRQNAKKFGPMLGALILAVLLVGTLVLAPCLVSAEDGGDNWALRDPSGVRMEDSGEVEPAAPAFGSPDGGDILFEQPPSAPLDAWSNGYLSDRGSGVLCFDDFWGLTTNIGDIHWYGFPLLCCFYDCDPTGMEFQIIFYQDSFGAPGAPVATFSNVLPTITYYDTFPMLGGLSAYRFEADLGMPVSLTNGWVSIESTYSPNGCFFYWLTSPTGNWNAIQQGGGGFLYDNLAFALTEAPSPFKVKYLHAEGGWMNITDPIGTQWHELYPLFCRHYHLSSWEDNGDGVLSACDQIDMYEKPDGEVRWYHVENVTITLFVTPSENIFVENGLDSPQSPLQGARKPMYIELEGGYNASVLINPVCTQWHEVYPVFCKRYHLSDWIDNGSLKLDPCDDIILTDKQTEEPTAWHVEDVAIDIIVTPKPPPVGGEAYPVNKASLLAPWIAVAAILAGGAIWYVVRRRRAQS
jgi:hypothetical protein